MLCHFSNTNGKAAKRAGKSDDLSEQTALRPSWMEGALLDLEDKNGTSPDRLSRSGDFFYLGPKKTLFGGREVNSEKKNVIFRVPCGFPFYTIVLGRRPNKG